MGHRRCIMNKTERHEALLARARKAVNAMYHNATLDFPSDMSNAHCEWFNQACSDEIDHLNDGGAYGNLDSMRKYLASIHKSTAAGRYHYAKHLREKAFEQERYARYERITEYGRLYTWGRGGATLAPDKLVQQRGGSSFSLSCESFEHMDWSQITRLTLTVEAFNKYVAQWCSKENISFMLSEQIAYEQAEKEEAEQDVYADFGVIVV